jgi:hypothetical protein
MRARDKGGAAADGAAAEEEEELTAGWLLLLVFLAASLSPSLPGCCRTSPCLAHCRQSSSGEPASCLFTRALHLDRSWF